MSMDFNRLLSPELIWVAVPLAAIVVGGTLAVLRQIHRHLERKALIEQGIHPDYPPDEAETRDGPGTPKRTTGPRGRG